MIPWYWALFLVLQQYNSAHSHWRPSQIKQTSTAVLFNMSLSHCPRKSNVSRIFRLMRGPRTLLLVYHSLQRWKPWCPLVIIDSRLRSFLKQRLIISDGEGRWLMRCDPKKEKKVVWIMHRDPRWWISTVAALTSSAVWLKRVMNWAVSSTTTSSLRNSVARNRHARRRQRGESHRKTRQCNSELQVSTGTLCRDKEAWMFQDLLSCSSWQNKSLSLSVCGFKYASGHLNKKKRKEKWIAPIQRNFNFSFFWTQISLMDLGGKEQWSGLAAKFGQMCQMARAMALRYSVWSVTIQFSQFSAPQPFIRIYFCHSPNSRASSIII